MMKPFVSFGTILVILALPLAAYAQEPTGTATAPISGSTAAAGHETAATSAPTLSADQSMKLHQHVLKEKKPSVKVGESVAVGTILPTKVELYSLPADLGLKTDYRYTVVNDLIVLAEAKSHKVVQIIN
jgi:hypothetical protein